MFHCLRYERNRTDFVCHIVGDGDSLEPLQELAEKLKLEECVKFTGFISDRDRIRQYLRMTDIGIEPAPENYLNVHSTFIKVMEYMAAGKPVVAFDLTESRYSLGGGGLLVPPGDMKGLADAIERLLDDPSLRNKLGQIGYQRVTKELKWESASLKLLDAYECLFR